MQSPAPSESDPRRPTASVSLDLDNLWSYMKTHGDAGWEARPTYLDSLVPLALDALGAHGIRTTFFIVGRDADDPRNRAALARLAEAGHEIGNHSYEHEPWLHRYSRGQVGAEIDRAEEAIVAATGVRPRGFRGPGYSWSADLLDVLVERGYLFDASTHPTYIGPLARAYYFWTAKLDAEQREERKELYGTMRDGLRPVTPYLWRLPGERTLLEIPVTTTPVLKTPFHLSYLLYLSRFSNVLMTTYLRAALAACRLAGVEPSFLLHPLDLLGGDRVPELAFFPGMDLPTERKLLVVHRVLRTLARDFELVTMGEHARRLLARGGLPLRSPPGAPRTAAAGSRLAPAVGAASR